MELLIVNLNILLRGIIVKLDILLGIGVNLDILLKIELIWTITWNLNLFGHIT